MTDQEEIRIGDRADVLDLDSILKLRRLCMETLKINPADVRVGSRVKVETEDSYNGMIGEVRTINETQASILFDGYLIPVVFKLLELAEIVRA